MNQLLVIGGCFAGAAACGLGAFINLRKARLIEDMPTSKIRSAHQGYVELLGVTEPAEGEPLVAPLSGKRCLWYQYHIERYQSGNKARWVTVEQGCSEQPFYLRDATGRSRVEPRGAEVSTSLRRQWTGTDRHPRQPAQRSLLAALVRQRYRYAEQRIIEGQPIYVVGDFTTSQPPSYHRQRQTRSREILGQWKRDQAALIKRFDRNGNGTVEQDEWDAARREAWREAALAADDAPDRSPAHRISKPAGGRPFLISTEAPENMARGYRFRSVLNLSALAGLCILGGWILCYSGMA